MDKCWFKTWWDKILCVSLFCVDVFLMWFVWNRHNVLNGILSYEVFCCANTVYRHFISSWNGWFSMLCIIFKTGPLFWKENKMCKWIWQMTQLTQYLFSFGEMVRRLWRYVLCVIFGSPSCLLMKSCGGLVCTLAGPIVLFPVFFALSSSRTDS